MTNASDRELLELIAAQVGGLTIKVDNLTEQVGNHTNQLNTLTADMEIVKEKLDQKADKTDIIRLENKIMSKIDALFDGYAQNSAKLDRIEAEVVKHEFILTKVK